MIMHWGAVRLRMNGSGNMRLQILGMDLVPIETLVPLVMSAAPGREPQRLSDTMSERVRVKLFTTDIDEKFDINRITIFAKPVFQSWPGD